MRTPNPDARGAGQPAQRMDSRPAETLATQICAALGYTVVVITIAVWALGSFTDDFGPGPAGISAIPVAAAWIAAIRWRARFSRRP